MPAFVSDLFFPARPARGWTRAGLAAAALGIALGLTGPAAAATLARSAPAVHAVNPGPIGHVITVASQVSFDGDNRAYDIASDTAGRTYLAWISAKANTSSTRAIHFCMLDANGCKGGVQTTTSPDVNASAPAGLRLLVSPAGEASVLWYADEATGGHVVEATSNRGGPLSAGKNVVSAASEGALLDAELGPDGHIWTVVWPGSTDNALQVRDGLTASPSTVKLHYSPGYASLAFAGSTPIIAFTEAGRITQPAAWSVRKGASWSKPANVKGTWAVGTNLGLTTTKTGVRLTTGDGGARIYQPVVSKWTGHGFSRIKFTGDHNSCAPGSHDTGTDASGRLTDVTDECGKITVSNLADTTHAAIVRFPSGGTPAGGEPQIATLPRGYAWVAWSTQFNSSSSGQGDKLKLTRLLLPGLSKHSKRHGKAGTVTLTGPVTCMPNSTLRVRVKGHAAHGWHVAKQTLKLGHKKQGKKLNGAALKAGKKYTLTGTVVFSASSGHSSVKAKLGFRACPNP